MELGIWIQSIRCGGVFNPVNFNLYHYGGNNPVKYTDPTGMWTDNEDGTSTAEAGDTLWDKYGADWKEKSGFDRDPRTLQVGETVGKSNSPTILSISGGANGATSKSQNSPTYYFNQNNGSQYYDNNGNLVLVGTVLPNPWETMGDALSSASFFLNCANLGCTFTGQFAAAEGCGTVAAGCDIGATFCYFVGGCNDKAVASLICVGLDFVPTAAYYFKPSLKAGYNMAAQRFINPATGRFITNTAGYTNYLAGPTTGITYSVGLSIYSKKKE